MYEFPKYSHLFRKVIFQVIRRFLGQFNIAGLLTSWAILPILMVNFVHAAVPEQTCQTISQLKQEVLTLEEVACLLRMNPHDIAKLARTHRIPGKLIGDHWRFRRQTVLDWLRQFEPSTSGVQHPRSDPGSDVQLKSELSEDGTSLHEPAKVLSHENALSGFSMKEISGKGSGVLLANNSSSASPVGQEPETIGEKKAIPTAEEVSLRGQQVLLNPQQLTLELDFSYTRSEDTGLTAIPTGPGSAVLGNSTGELDRFIWSFNARYGLPHDLLLIAGLPLIHQRQRALSTSPATTTTNTDSDSLTETGDLFLGLRQTTIKEDVGYPEVILSVQTLIPTRKSSFGLGGGIALIKRVDPVALFANFGYVHVFSREFTEISRLRPENIFNVNFGYAFSMNESLAFSTSVLGTFTTRTKFDNPNLPILRGIERFFLRASLTALLTEKVFVEPFVTFSLNGPDIVTLGVSIPYTFDLEPFLAKMFR